MRKILLLSLFSISASAFAQDPPAALIDLDAGTCGVGTSVGSPVGVSTDDTKLFITQNVNTCTVNFVCKGRKEEPGLDTTAVVEGFRCSIWSDDLDTYLTTDDSHFVVTPSGRWKLICQVHDCDF